MRIPRNGWSDHAPLGSTLPDGRVVRRRSAHWASTARGWLFREAICRGNYLDYGDLPHYQNRPAVHAVRYPAGPSTAIESESFLNVGSAREWIEEGGAP